MSANRRKNLRFKRHKELRVKQAETFYLYHKSSDPYDASLKQRIREVVAPNFGPGTRLSCCVAFLRSSRQMFGYHLEYAATTSFLIPSNSLLVHPTYCFSTLCTYV